MTKRPVPHCFPDEGDGAPEAEKRGLNPQISTQCDLLNLILSSELHQVQCPLPTAPLLLFRKQWGFFHAPEQQNNRNQDN
jgi:hypothetical protein